MSQIRMVPSQPPDASRVPSGENATVPTPRWWPSSVAFTFPCGQVPERDRAGRIERAVGDGQGLAIGRVSEGPHGREVAPERGPRRLPPRGQAPELDRVVLAGRGQRTAIGRENNLQDDVAMSFQQADLAGAVGVPDDHVPVLVRRRQIAAVGREGDGLARAVLERIARRERGGVPEPDDPVGPGRRDDVPSGENATDVMVPFMTANDARGCAGWRHPRA